MVIIRNNSFLSLDLSLDIGNNSLTNAPATAVALCDFPSIQGTIFVVINIFLATVGTFGNILIIAAILDTPQLRQKVSNFLLLSLAFADLLVTIGAQPVFIFSMSLRTFTHQCTEEVELAYAVVAVLGWISVFHLAVISIDRAISTTKPHQYHNIIKRWWKKMLFICWGTGMILSCLVIPVPIINTAVATLLFVSFVIIILAYSIILHKVKFSTPIQVTSMSSSTSAQSAMERRVSGTIAIVILLFAICWIPFLVILTMFGLNTTNIPVKYWWSRTLYLANSSMNFIVYSLRIRHFRVAYARIIHRIADRIRELLGKCF